MIAVKFKALKTKNFFDRSKIEKAISRQERTVLRTMGFRIRQSARKLLGVRKYVNRKGEPNKSEPGKAPFGHERDGLRKIFYSYDTSERQMVVGPVKFKAGKSVPALHEFGGTVTTRRGRARYPKRRFMGPTLEKHLPDLPELWASVK